MFCWWFLAMLLVCFVNADEIADALALVVSLQAKVDQQQIAFDKASKGLVFQVTRFPTKKFVQTYFVFFY